MLNVYLIVLGKIIVFISRMFNLGHGSTWPGHIALLINKNFINEIVKTNQQLKIILIAGTNGKTTTAKLIQTILEKSNYKVFQNEAGANLLNGIASSLLLHSDILCKINFDYAIFEVDENTLPLVLKKISPGYLILLNLFRDQLDRYGEVNTIVQKWAGTILHLLPKTKLILNADDPQIANLGKNTRSLYYGLNDKKLEISTHQHAVDSTYCPNCNSKLFYNTIYYSHLGDWECKNCKIKRPRLDLSNTDYYPAPGTYNRYNTLASVLLAKQIGIEQKNINSALHKFTPAFGRQEILEIDGKRVQIFLSKNPTSYNESLKTITDLGSKNVLFVLNDRIPDGLDVSWIWDVDFEDYINKLTNIIISGDRAYDMSLRIKYATQNSNVISQNYNSKFKTYESLLDAIKEGLIKQMLNETLYILPTYSAMLEVRHILTGKKIL